MSKLTEPGGRTPLHLAAAAGGGAIVGMLLSAGADRSAEDWQGATPFLLACRRGHHAIAQQLAAAAVAERSRSGGQGGDGAEAEEREEDDGGEEVRMPLEQELRGFELVEGIAVRARAAARLSIDERPKLHEPFTLMAPLLSAVDCASVVAEAEAVAARQGGWCSTRHKNHPVGRLRGSNFTLLADPRQRLLHTPSGPASRQTVDLPLHELGVDTYHRLRRRLEAAVLPAMAARYESRPLCVREAFIAKYQARRNHFSRALSPSPTLLTDLINPTLDALELAALHAPCSSNDARGRPRWRALQRLRRGRS